MLRALGVLAEDQEVEAPGCKRIESRLARNGEHPDFPELRGSFDDQALDVLVAVRRQRNGVGSLHHLDAVEPAGADVRRSLERVEAVCGDEDRLVVGTEPRDEMAESVLAQQVLADARRRQETSEEIDKESIGVPLISTSAGA